MPFTNMIGNGGVLSTMSDLMKWNANLDHPSVGGAAYVDAMQTRMRLTNGRTITYALGLEVQDYDGVREVSHSGSTAGYRTFLARYPEQKVSIAVWCNHAGANPTSLAHKVADLVLVKQPTTAAQASVVHADVPASALARWVGKYRDAHTDQTMAFVSSAGGLTTKVGARTIAWTPLGDDAFKSDLGTIVMRGAPGRRTGVLARQSGDTSRFEELRTPAAVPVDDYTGVYASDELDTRFTIVARGGTLYLERRPADSFELRPAYVDDFQTGGGLGTLRFARDASGKVSGFSFYAGRVLDVRYKRVAGAR
jgi:hypothetical protein